MPHYLLFTAPHTVDVCYETLPQPGEGQLLVQTRYSAISAGTELLLYRGQMPLDLPLDESIAALQGEAHYPVRYGYAAVGTVLAVGKNVDKLWIGRPIFAFYPHASHFVVDKAAVHPIPEGIALADAVFLPSMETAVSFVMDSQPIIGERVAVFGQGVVGLLTSALLAKMALAHLVVVDGLAQRRAQALAWGATEALDPHAPDTAAFLRQYAADLSLELSGNPAALDMALEATGFNGRIVVGSWYGEKRVSLNLGGRFHRAHQTLVSSQVSELKPQWLGRWDKQRRLDQAWRMIAAVKPSQLITHRLPLANAAVAYNLLDQHPAEALQIIFEYAGED